MRPEPQGGAEKQRQNRAAYGESLKLRRFASEARLGTRGLGPFRQGGLPQAALVVVAKSRRDHQSIAWREATANTDVVSSNSLVLQITETGGVCDVVCQYR